MCTGNICRSPIAERLAAAYSARLQVRGIQASSAGTRARAAERIHDNAASVLAALGGDASNFSAQRLTPKIAHGADLILTMTVALRDEVLEVAPQRLHRTFTMSEAAQIGSDYRVDSFSDVALLRPQLDPCAQVDIPDPMGRGPEFFAMVGGRIAAYLPPIIEVCHRLSASS